MSSRNDDEKRFQGSFRDEFGLKIKNGGTLSEKQTLSQVKINLVAFLELAHSSLTNITISTGYIPLSATELYLTRNHL